jgi:hypothetical protein
MRKIILLLVMVTLTIILVSCADTTKTNTSSISLTSGSMLSTNWQDQVTHSWVVAHRQNWNADAQDDGIRVWIKLLDKNEKMVEYNNTDIPIKIELYATESKTYPMKPSRLLYSGISIAKGWLHDSFVTGAIGVKDIAWEEILPTLQSEQQDYGLIFITVTLPNGKDFSAQYDEAEIRKR